MLILPGAPALSDFRLEKLKAALAASIPSLRDVSAQYIHLVDTAVDLDPERSAVLSQLLHYGPVLSLLLAKACSFLWCLDRALFRLGQARPVISPITAAWI